MANDPIWQGAPPYRLVGPYVGAALATAQANELTQTSRAIYIATSGALTVTMLNGGNSVTFNAVPAGTVLEIRATHITACPANTVVLW